MKSLPKATAHLRAEQVKELDLDINHHVSEPSSKTLTVKMLKRRKPFERTEWVMPFMVENLPHSMYDLDQ